MKKWVSAFAVLLTCGAFTGVTIDAEARRVGGGRSLGVQRQAIPPRQAPAQPPATQPGAPVNQAAPGAGAPAQAGPAGAAATSPAGTAGVPARQVAPQAQAAPSPGAAAQPRSGMSRWLGPVAGIAAGLGLAALLSHFGLSEAFAGLLLLVLLGVGLMLLVGWIMRRSAGGQPTRYAGAGSAGNIPLARDAASGAGNPAARGNRDSGVAPAALPPQWAQPRSEPLPAAAAASAQVPEQFDAEAFLHHARANFNRLQAAFDSGDLASLRDVMTPEMYAQIRRDVAERGAHRATEVVKLDSRIVEVQTEGNAHWVGVRFSGLMREDGAEIATPFDEVWNLTKPVDGSSGWVLAGIQQVG